MCFALVAIAAYAQESIRIECPNLVAVGEQFNVTFVIEGENAPSSFSWEPGSDFQTVWGPQKGTSTSIQIINGKRSRSSQTTYTYILLPRSTGRFTLPAATASVKGKNISSGQATVEVVSDQSSSRSGQGGSQSGSSGSSQGSSSSGSISSEDMFLRLSLSRTSVVVGEPVTATLKLCSRVNISGFDSPKFPTFNGFWSQEVEAPTNIQFHRENIGDRIYDVATLRRWVLIPQQSGSIKIDPAELICLVNVRSSSTGNSIFDSFFDDYTTVRKRLTTGAATVNVKSLPSGAPASFGGGVGNFSMNVKFSKDSLRTHDAASILVTVSGKGNISLLTAPSVRFPSDFDVYDTKISENTNKGDGRISGSKTFEYPFIPRSHGEFDIPPIEYSYYDINAGKYVTLKSDPIHLNVARGSASQTTSTGEGTIVVTSNKQDVKNLGSDVRYIHPKTPAFKPVGTFFFGSTLFWVLSLLILASGLAVAVALRKLAAMRADVAMTRNRKATKMARTRLAQAGNFLSKDLYTAFYEELHKALQGFVSDKLNMDMSELSKENISQELSSRGVPEESVKTLTGLLDACEYARYSPDAGHDAMHAHYDSAVKVISTIDSLMKSKKTLSGTSGTAMLLMLCMLVPFHAKAEGEAFLDSLWTKGTEAYASGDWEGAVSSWQTIANAGVESEELYYNLGNACFKGGDFPHAILYFERTLKLDPSHSDARFNLELANAMIQDKIESVPQFVLSSWARKVCWWLKSDAWAILFLFLLAGAVGMFLLFRLAGTPGARKLGFYSAIVLILLALMAFLFARWQRRDYYNADSAIVMRPVSSVKSSPSDDSSSKDLFVLHEGTKVKLLDEVGSWKNIELADGRQGWIPGGDVEVI